jgi:hypothetical protein
MGWRLAMVVDGIGVAIANFERNLVTVAATWNVTKL